MSLEKQLPLFEKEDGRCQSVTEKGEALVLSRDSEACPKTPLGNMTMQCISLQASEQWWSSWKKLHFQAHFAKKNTAATTTRDLLKKLASMKASAIWYFRNHSNWFPSHPLCLLGVQRAKCKRSMQLSNWTQRRPGARHEIEQFF